VRYRMIGVDLDGTLLGGDGRVSVENRAAIARAQDAGVLIVPCTGRAWHESHRAIDDVPGLNVGVFVTGALVNDIATGRALHIDAMDGACATRLIDELRDLPDAVLVFRERGATGCDYLITGRGALPDNTNWWFNHTGALVTHAPQLRDEHLTHVLRVGMVSHDAALDAAYERIAEACAGVFAGHCFGGIVRNDLGERVRIIEMFAPHVNKWTGLRWVAREHGIDESQIAVIGDEINDVPMFTAAGCGIAMGNAVHLARLHARYVTATVHEHGVAYAIDRMLEGVW